MKLKRSYRSTKRRLRKNARSVRKTRGQRRRRLQKSRRRSTLRRKRQRGGYQTTSVAPNVTMEVTQPNTTVAVSEAVNVPTTECTPFVSNSDIFQSTFEPVSSNNVNSVNNYLLLNNNSNYVKMI